MSELGVWEAMVGGPGIAHAWATVRGTPEDAVAVALARAGWKYGQSDFTGWRLRAELQSVPVTLRTVHLAWRGGELVRL